MMAAPIQAPDPERRRRRAALPSMPMALVREVAYRFMLFHAVQGGRLDRPAPELRAAIGEFLWLEAGPIRANSRSRREVARGVQRILSRTERAAPGGTAPRASTPVDAPIADE